MDFNAHYNLKGAHAFLGASKYHWLKYSDEKLVSVYRNSLEAARGDRLHELARQLITEGVTLPRSTKTLNRYVNDAIGFGMTPEQMLFYSLNCFGTTDAISFKQNLLRIHDLKTGVSPTSMFQPKIYAGLFCLEYKFHPKEIKMELRIYQHDDVEVCIPEVDEIVDVMERIVTCDTIVERVKTEG